ncbi:helix-turn-helix domain-containing protein [Streptomyces sp. NPDC101225]|uniref:helix-turn-helix domain-containing protein n=1 Tax=Streptomyces sp. NPDC101225 TaxID=3366135 RepID=UPI0037FC0E6B
MSTRNVPLRALRRNRGWTLGQAASLARMDASHLSKVERGVAGVSVDTLARLAAIYDLTDLGMRLKPFVQEAE